MRRPVALAVVVCLLASLVALPVAAAPPAAAPSVVVGETETVEGFATVGGVVVVRGTVAGDLTAHAGRVVITETGVVEGQLRASGGVVAINGTVEETAIGYAGRVTVGETGEVRRSLGAVAGLVRVDGRVGGDLTTAAPRIELGPEARIGGDLNYDGDLIDEGATVDGQRRGPGDLALLPALPVPGWVVALYWLVSDLLVGALALAVAPRFADAAVDVVADEPVRTTATGAAVGLAGVLLAVAATFTLIGIPFALALAGALVIAAWLGSVLVRYALGAYALDRTDVDNEWAALVVGVVGVALLARIPVLGTVVRLAVVCAGIGLIALGIRTAYLAVERSGPGGGL